MAGGKFGWASGKAAGSIYSEAEGALTVFDADGSDDRFPCVLALTLNDVYWQPDRHGQRLQSSGEDGLIKLGTKTVIWLSNRMHSDLSPHIPWGDVLSWEDVTYPSGRLEWIVEAVSGVRLEFEPSSDIESTREFAHHVLGDRYSIRVGGPPESPARPT